MQVSTKVSLIVLALLQLSAGALLYDKWRKLDARLVAVTGEHQKLVSALTSVNAVVAEKLVGLEEFDSRVDGYLTNLGPALSQAFGIRDQALAQAYGEVTVLGSVVGKLEGKITKLEAQVRRLQKQRRRVRSAQPHCAFW
jgi:hypothetical protein